MQKLKLNVEDLSVDSFALEVSEGPRGTVHGAEPTDGCSQYCSPTVFEYIWYQTWKQQDLM